MQGRSMAQGRQRPRSTKAMPMRMGPWVENASLPRRSSREMGRIAGENSDLVFITTDNPRTEDPESIISQIEAGVGLETEAAFDRLH